MPLNFSEGDHLKDEKLRDELYVSCWHNDPAESAAMWSLYSTKESGIAIQTTSDRFSDALQNCQKEVELAAVEYMEIFPGLFSGKALAYQASQLPARAGGPGYHSGCGLQKAWA